VQLVASIESWRMQHPDSIALRSYLQIDHDSVVCIVMLTAIVPGVMQLLFDACLGDDYFSDSRQMLSMKWKLVPQERCLTCALAVLGHTT
jgi:hypothetical protein